MISRQTYLVVQRALKSQVSSVKASKTWLKVHHELLVGTRLSDKINLTAEDREIIRTWYKNTIGADPLFDDLDGDRIDVSGKSNQEKLSNKNVFEDLIKVSCNNGPIPFHKGNGVTPWHTILEIETKDVCWDKVKKIVIVENGYAIRQWHDFNTPKELDGAIAIYRGHSNDARIVSDLIKAIPKHIKLYGFYDYDPSGMNIATMYPYDAILLPELSDDILLTKNNKIETYYEQNSKVEDISTSLLEPWKDHWQWMHDKKVAFTQEKMIVLKTKLYLL